MLCERDLHWSISSKNRNKKHGENLWKTNPTSILHEAVGYFQDNAVLGIKNPHNLAHVKSWGIWQPHRSRWKFLYKTCNIKNVQAAVKIHGKRVWKCGISYHNGVTCHVRTARLSGHTLLKELRFCVFINKTSWQNRVSVLLYFLQVTSVHLQQSNI